MWSIEQPDLTPEQRLLLLTGRYCGDEPPPSEEALSLAPTVTNWGNFIRLANQHGVIALVHDTIERCGMMSLLPGEAALTLRKSSLSSLARNTMIYETLATVSSLAAEGGIGFTPVKGVVLERCLYGDRGLRQMSDIDIVTSAGDAMRFHNLLRGKGYRSLPFKSPIHKMMMMPASKHLPEIDINGIYTEIHFRLFSDKGNRMTEAMLAGSNPDERCGGMRVPPHGLHFLYLASHLGYHEEKGESQLRLYNDIALMLRRYGPELSYSALVGAARTTGTVNAVAHAVAVADLLYSGCGVTDWPAPEGDAAARFLSFLDDPKGVERDSTVAGQSGMTPPPGGMAGRLLFALGAIFPSLSWMKRRYGTRSRLTALFYYPVRWVSGLRRVVSGSKGAERR